MDHRWQEIEALYRRATGLDASERAVFLDKACGHDRELHREVESLLAGSDRPSSLLETRAIEGMVRELAGDAVSGGEGGASVATRSFP